MFCEYLFERKCIVIISPDNVDMCLDALVQIFRTAPLENNTSHKLCLAFFLFWSPTFWCIGAGFSWLARLLWIPTIGIDAEGNTCSCYLQRFIVQEIVLRSCGSIILIAFIIIEIGSVYRKKTTISIIGLQYKSVSKSPYWFESLSSEIRSDEPVVGRFCQFLSAVNEGINTNHRNADDDYHHDDFYDRRTRLTHGGGIKWKR